MRTIKFSHEYDKFPRDYKISKLLEVFIADASDLHEGFVEYDTAYGIDGRNYPLPKGKLIVLLLRTRDSRELWTTTRRCYQQRLEYYMGLRGSYVKCEVH